MKTLDLCQQFYEEIGAPAIAAAFPEQEGRIAVGLVGRGSECFGYEDETSLDHDLFAGFCLWIPEEDEPDYGFRLSALYDHLPAEFGGLTVQRRSRMGDGKLGVKTIGAFYQDFTGSPGAPETWQQWMRLPSHSLAKAVNGRVFRDDLGEFSRIRQEIALGMPEDVRLKKIAAHAALMAQSGQYNYSRCLKHGEPGAAVLALNEFVNHAAQLGFLLCRRHAPYYKWTLRAMGELPGYAGVRDRLEQLLLGTCDRTDTIEAVSAFFISRLRQQRLTHGTWDYLEPHAYAVMEQIENPEIRALHIMEG